MKINIRKEESITKALDAVQSRATARKFSTAQIVAEARSAENRLNKLGIALAERIGAQRVLYADYGQMPSTYKYAFSVTVAILERGAKDWFLVDVQRKEFWPGEKIEDVFLLTESQKQKAINNFLNDNGIR